MRPELEARTPSSRSRRHHPLYETWRGMLKRCYQPTATGYANYGGRGIGVCARWRDSFDAFVADVSPRPTPAHSLDRIDNNGDYAPENIRWATKSEQRRNCRQSPVYTIGCVTGTLCEWAARSGVPRTTILNRLRRGWSLERALLQPSRLKAPTGSVLPRGVGLACAVNGIHLRTVQSRVRRGWPLDRALMVAAGPQRGGRVRA